MVRLLGGSLKLLRYYWFEEGIKNRGPGQRAWCSYIARRRDYPVGQEAKLPQSCTRDRLSLLAVEYDLPVS
jgi:hypothetical protein